MCRVINIGYIIYRCILVASGQFAATIFPYPYPHDAAAAKLLVDEAGGTTTNLWGNQQRYDQDTQGFVFATPLVHEEMLDVIQTVKN